MNPVIDTNARTPPGDHVQLVVGDKATVRINEYLRAQGAANAASSDNVLTAEGPDANNDGNYDIGLNWLTSPVIKQGTQPSGLVTLTPTGVTCKAHGLQSCTGLDISLVEPHGNMIRVSADLEITCQAPGVNLVPVETANAGNGTADSYPSNNVSYIPVVVWCYAQSSDRQTDGIDDSSGLYVSFTTQQSDGSEVRISAGPGNHPQTGLPSDITYSERWLDQSCNYFDSDGAPDGNGDNWISPAESMAQAPAGIDDDGDCLADASLGQPGNAVDRTTTPRP